MTRFFSFLLIAFASMTAVAGYYEETDSRVDAAVSVGMTEYDLFNWKTTFEHLGVLTCSLIDDRTTVIVFSPSWASKAVIESGGTGSGYAVGRNEFTHLPASMLRKLKSDFHFPSGTELDFFGAENCKKSKIRLVSINPKKGNLASCSPFSYKKIDREPVHSGFGYDEQWAKAFAVAYPADKGCIVLATKKAYDQIVSGLKK